MKIIVDRILDLHDSCQHHREVKYARDLTSSLWQLLAKNSPGSQGGTGYFTDGDAHGLR